ncbi:hypothetical protein SBRY_50466 [Actinacidiphila bryophytorum]|uniref:Uncharacterized protein n=1 Tax=Actinacidiphila bryophytorum TaxID=1436133 RepID=A0A9W4H4S7_9ACTN|nr:hypothetical protein SBRY_50466 [Actinacidiphila bryophytorum]
MAEDATGLCGTPGEGALLVRRVPTRAYIREPVDSDVHIQSSTPEDPSDFGRLKVEGNSLDSRCPIEAHNAMQQVSKSVRAVADSILPLRVAVSDTARGPA